MQAGSTCVPMSVRWQIISKDSLLEEVLDLLTDASIVSTGLYIQDIYCIITNFINLSPTCQTTQLFRHL